MMEVMPVASQPIYQFYAELKDYKPLIWRRFQVAGNITLAQLGYVTMTLFEMNTKASQTRSCDMILPVATHSLKR